jgi:hypothetical protein
MVLIVQVMTSPVWGCLTMTIFDIVRKKIERSIENYENPTPTTFHFQEQSLKRFYSRAIWFWQNEGVNGQAQSVPQVTAPRAIWTFECAK